MCIRDRLRSYPWLPPGPWPGRRRGSKTARGVGAGRRFCRVHLHVAQEGLALEALEHRRRQPRVLAAVAASLAPLRAAAATAYVQLVVATYDEDLSWVRQQPYPAVVYEKRDPDASGLHGVPRNTANEASAFLKFIVDYYDALPRAMVFLHGHRYAYHMEDVLGLLADLDVASFDYCNLNFAVWGTHELSLIHI